MKTKSLGFIGGGRITKIILQAFKNRSVKFSRIVVFDSNMETSEKLQTKFPDIELSDLGKAASQELVIIALHPPVIMETLDKIQSIVTEKTSILSLAPRITLEKLSGKLNQVNKLTRLIPNAASVMSKGYNPVCFSAGMAANEKAEILEILQNLGETFEVPESKLEAYAIVSAMAPTYFWFQWKKLAEIGEEIGLGKEESQKAVYQTLSAALDTMFQSGLSDDEVFDLIPVKPIGEYEDEIKNLFDAKLKGLYAKLSS